MSDAELLLYLDKAKLFPSLIILLILGFFFAIKIYLARFRKTAINGERFKTAFATFVFVLLASSQAFGLAVVFDSKEVSELNLLDNTDQCLTSCSATLEIANKQDLSLLDSGLFGLRTLNTDLPITTYKLTNVSRDEFVVVGYENFSVSVQSNESEGLTEEVRERPVWGYVPRFFEEWTPYDLASNKNVDTIQLRITTNKKPFEEADWIVKYAGVEVSEWAWWNSSWLDKKSLTIINPDSSAKTNTLVNVSFSDVCGSPSKCKADYSDMRILDVESNVEVSWDYFNGANASRHGFPASAPYAVFLADTYQNGSFKSYEVYYNNPSAGLPDYNSSSVKTPILHLFEACTEPSTLGSWGNGWSGDFAATSVITGSYCNWVSLQNKIISNSYEDVGNITGDAYLQMNLTSVNGLLQNQVHILGATVSGATWFYGGDDWGGGNTGWGGNWGYYTTDYFVENTLGMAGTWKNHYNQTASQSEVWYQTSVEGPASASHAWRSSIPEMSRFLIFSDDAGNNNITFNYLILSQNNFTYYPNITASLAGEENNLAVADSGTNPTVPVLNDAVYFWVNVTGESLAWCNFTAQDPLSRYVLNNENASSNVDGVWNSTNFNANQTGVYEWNVTCGDTGSNTASYNSSFLSNDTTPPEIIIVEPNGTYASRSNISLNFSWVDYGGLNTCWYTLDNGTTNNTISCDNTTFSVGSNGDYTMVFYAEDAGDNVAFNSSGFNVNEPIQVITTGGGGGGGVVVKNITAKSSLPRIDKYVLTFRGGAEFSETVKINKKVVACQTVGSFNCSYKDFDAFLTGSFKNKQSDLYSVENGELLVESEDGDAVRIPITAHVVNAGYSLPAGFVGNFNNEWLFSVENGKATGVRLWWLAIIFVTGLWWLVERNKTSSYQARQVIAYKKKLFRRLQ